MQEDNSFGMGEKLYTIPQDSETRESILNIDKNTRYDLRQIHRLYVDTNWECNTIAGATIETLIKVMGSHLTSGASDALRFIPGSDRFNTHLNFYDLFDIQTTNKMNSYAEKEGNINIAFYPGKRSEEIIGDDTPREERKYEKITAEAKYTYVDSPEMTKAILKIDKLARRDLSEKNSILLPKEFMAIATTYIFIENIYRELMFKLALTKKPSVMINFNDIIEFHATIKKDKTVDITLRPGYASKLIIKSDETTEDDYDE